VGHMAQALEVSLPMAVIFGLAAVVGR